MANELTTSAVRQRARSFWDTREGTTGMIVGAGLFGAIGWAAYKLMPYIANLLENTVYALLFGALAVGLFYVLVIDSTLRNRLWLIYQLLMRALTYSIIRYDPVGVLRETQKMAKARIQRVSDAIDKVKGKMRILRETTEGFRRDQQKLKEETLWMQQHGKSQLEINSHAMKIGRLEESIGRLSTAYQQINGVADKLDHAFETLTVMNSNIDFEIDLQEKEYAAANAAHEAWSALRSAFAGNTGMDQMRVATLTYMADDYNNKMGQIDSFVNDSEKYIAAADMQNDMYAEKGLKLLEKLNSQTFDLDISPRLQTPAVVPSTANVVDFSHYKN
ncbi:hypothetical protein B0G62_102686 [Paraburkholderia eburnea]|uniref:Uncharacterized protein n=1 Tax=Paraburkholderia eburnea TaxID=1189126 RepID=A0A2S4MKB8_9BURK|nr:hypothetical protein [Paraburkholderia eburnea]POR55075.1 hypothetical protein B0G62_102686 [Paraburkholderia eburnea]PRZ24325.1 hypothetical protein BX588_10343 [Paraburkholderia eburnea]